MADNIIAGLGTQDGATFATDDNGGVHFPGNKVMLGANNTFHKYWDGTVYLGGLDIQTSHTSKASVAPGAETVATDLDSTEVTNGKTGHLVKIVVASSVPWKARLTTVSNAVESSVQAVWFGHQQPIFDVPRGAITVLGTTGLDVFRLYVTNLAAGATPDFDADIYATFFWDEV